MGKKDRLKAIGNAGRVIDVGGIFAYAREAGMIPSLAARFSNVDSKLSLLRVLGDSCGEKILVLCE
ncbi:hypothetical protein F2Q69_00021971 [Brassica cretica]|uniref:Uncharacterized protein n=1 Tax=Brassica cretica TaxID=69181 RepID=A0A8S9Q9V4_BRACR|nr:hypothetical protein F2Q69_00021971 [Brassica cretica]